MFNFDDSDTIAPESDPRRIKCSVDKIPNTTPVHGLVGAIRELSTRERRAKARWIGRHLRLLARLELQGRVYEREDADDWGDVKPARSEPTQATNYALQQADRFSEQLAIRFVREVQEDAPVPGTGMSAKLKLCSDYIYGSHAELAPPHHRRALQTLVGLFDFVAQLGWVGRGYEAIENALDILESIHRAQEQHASSEAIEREYKQAASELTVPVLLVPSKFAACLAPEDTLLGSRLEPESPMRRSLID